MRFKGLINIIGNFIVKNSPAILTGMGVAGVIMTSVMTAKSTITAHDDYISRSLTGDEPESKIDIVKMYWKDYIPPMIMGGATIACIIGANTVNTKRQLALASAYSLAETSLKEYQDQVREMVGEKKERLIRDNVDKKRLEENRPSEDKVIVTGSGDCLCYDQYTGRYFMTDIEKVKRTENELNKRLLSEMFISLNEFYYAIGLDPVQMGNELGWNVNEEGLIDIRYSSQIVDYNGREMPCLVISYQVGPRFNFGDS